MLSKSSLKPDTDFYATGINIFLVSKNVLIIIVLISINKNVFEPSYNDLKAMVYGEGNGNPLQYSCLEKSMDRGVWRAEVHGITWLSMCAWEWREMGW